MRPDDRHTRATTSSHKLDRVAFCEQYLANPKPEVYRGESSEHIRKSSWSLIVAESGRCPVTRVSASELHTTRVAHIEATLIFLEYLDVDVRYSLSFDPFFLFVQHNEVVFDSRSFSAGLHGRGHSPGEAPAWQRQGKGWCRWYQWSGWKLA